MNEKYDIDVYSKLESGASFFLQESFNYIHIALSYEYAGILFSEKIENIEPSIKDRKMTEVVDIPDNPVELLQSQMPDVLTEETSKLMYEAWEKSQMEAENGSYNFQLNHRITNIEILGHINNLGFFIETLINRHLLFLKQTKVMDDFSYTRVSKARIIERIIYIFKDELRNDKVHLNEIASLFNLRNKTVHFTPDNANALKPRLSELIQIWKQCIKIIEKLEKAEKFTEEKFSERLNNNINYIKERWN
jgi:hypothetical protein